MDYAKVKSYAKINLTLDVLGVSGGYHMLDSVVASIDLYDLVSVKKRRDGLVTVTMHGEGSESIDYERNNAARAAEAFAAAFDTCGADVTVWKNIPMGAGLGGSSADVAGVLRAMAAVYGVDDGEAIKSLADGLGSDCGYMLTGGYARIRGRGERVTPLDSSLRLDIGLLVPRSGVSTAECYRLCDGFAQGEKKSALAEEAVIAGDEAALSSCLSNGLYAPAKALNPDVERAVLELKEFDPLGVNMTGSGSAAYAIFENDQFLSYARSRYRGKFSFITAKTVIPGRNK